MCCYFPILTNLPSFNHHLSFLMPSHSLCDSDVLRLADRQTGRSLGRSSLVADHFFYRSSLSSPDPRTNPSPVPHNSDRTLPQPDLCGLFVTVVYIQSALFVRVTLVHLRLFFGNCLWGRFFFRFLSDFTFVVLINMRNSSTCTSLICIL